MIRANHGLPSVHRHNAPQPMTSDQDSQMTASQKGRSLAAQLPIGALALGLVAGLLLAPSDAEAQRYGTFGAGWAAGASYVTDVNPDASADAFAVTPETGFVMGLYVDSWLGSTHRVGLRTQASYQQPRFDWEDGRRSIDAGSADLSLLIRPISPDDGNVLPYLAGGAGIIWYDLGTGGTTVFPDAEAMHDGDSRILPTGVIAVGVDVPIDMRWNRLPVSLRLEAADHITINSPLKRTADGERHGAVHHFRFTVGLYSTLLRH